MGRKCLESGQSEAQDLRVGQTGQDKPMSRRRSAFSETTASSSSKAALLAARAALTGLLSLGHGNCITRLDATLGWSRGRGQVDRVRAAPEQPTMGQDVAPWPPIRVPQSGAPWPCVGPAALPPWRIRDHLSFSWLTCRTTSAVSRETCRCRQRRGSSADVVAVAVVVVVVVVG
jgi:hypothetical protein